MDERVERGFGRMDCQDRGHGISCGPASEPGGNHRTLERTFRARQISGQMSGDLTRWSMLQDQMMQMHESVLECRCYRHVRATARSSTI